MVVVQYPDTATIPGKAAESIIVDGITSAGSTPASLTQIGRYEPSTLNQEIQVADGTKTKIKGIFYMPVNAPDVDAGVDFKIVNRLNDVVLQTKVLFFTRGQLNCRVYL